MVLSIDTLRYEKELNEDVLFLHSVIHSCVDIIQSVQHEQNCMSLEEKVIAYMKYQCDDHILRRIEKHQKYFTVVEDNYREYFMN